MVMPIKGKRGRNLLELPPELEQLPDEEGYLEIEALPWHLQPEKWFALMRKNFPEKLYRAQLEDYLTSELNAGRMTIEQAEDANTKADNYSRWRYPVTSFPYFKEIQALTFIPQGKVRKGAAPVYGQELQAAYLEYAENYIREELEDQMKREEYVTELSERYGVDALEQAGIITQREGARYRASRENLKSGVYAGLALQGQFDPDITKALTEGAIEFETASTLQKQRRRAGVLGEANRQLPYSLKGRQDLEAAVRQGYVSPEEAWGAGSNWEKWQHEEARQAREAQASAKGKQDLAQWRASPQAQDAKRYGIDTSMYEAVLADGGYPAETVAKIGYQVGLQVNQSRMAENERKASMLTKDFPDLYQKYMETADMSQRQPINFWSWARGTMGDDGELLPNPEFQKPYLERESARWKDWGQIYPSYLKAKRGMTPETFKPFETWMEEEPTVSGWAKQEKMRREEEQRRRERYLAPPAIR